MKFPYKINYFILIISSIFIYIKSNSLTPLSLCTKGRVSQHINFEKGTCSFGKLLENKTTKESSSYLFPAAINQDLYKNSAQCGVCYEMVGPTGAIRVRVEDNCSKNNERGLCRGDMPHFNVAENGTSYIMGKADNVNITFRMISCDYSGNIRILTDENINKNYLSFIVLDHNIGVSYIEMKEYNTNIWTNITRSNDNKWVYYNFQNGITFPLTLRIYSINGDYVTVTMNNPEVNKYYEANNNFIIPNNNNYFNIETLTKININSNNNNVAKCCERDKSDFTPIYTNGYINEGYNDYQQKVTVEYNSYDAYFGTYSMKAKFESTGNLIFESPFPIRADQFKGVFFMIKSNQICSDCLYFRAYNLNDNNKNIIFDQANVWKNYSFSFDELGIKNNEFNGIVFNYYKYTNEYLEVNIDKIELIPNPNAPDAGICTGSTNQNNDDISPDPNDDNNGNNDDQNTYNYIRINSIIINENAPNILNIKSDQFTNNENKQIALKLIPKSNLNIKSVDINNCTFSNPYLINLFTCTLPSNISDGIYNIRTQTTNGLNFIYSEEVEIKKGVFICGNVDTRMKQYSSVYYSPLIIIYSKEQIISKGDKVKFDIYPIPQEEYNLDNNEVILLNARGDKALHLKYCHQNIKNKTVYSIQCTVSNNMMKDNYTNLYSNQIISLLGSQNMNLIGSSSNGGILKNSFSQIVDSNLTSSQKQNFNITFDVLYYNSKIKPGNKFPHNIFLYGVKKNSRKLDDQTTVYDSQITLRNCTAGDYSTEDYNAIGSITCRVPDFVPAGTYSKLESDGIDINPQNSINLIFEKDFNRSSEVKNQNKNSDTNEKKSSSKRSKDWIAWLIVGIVAVVLPLIVIVILICRKSDSSDESSTNKVNDSSAPANKSSD